MRRGRPTSNITTASEYISARFPSSTEVARLSLFSVVRTSGAIDRTLVMVGLEEAGPRRAISRPHSEIQAIPSLSTRILFYVVVSPS